MFSSRFFARKNLLKKGFPLFFVLCLVMGSALFSSCDWSGGTGGGDLNGIWTDPQAHDTYKITNSIISYDDNIPDFDAMDFTGSIVSIDYFDSSNSSGVIIFRYTKGQPNTGRLYGAVYYRELKETQMSMATAGRWDSAPPYGDLTPVIISESQAKEEFTRDNSAKYVSRWGGPYIKQ